MVPVSRAHAHQRPVLADREGLGTVPTALGQQPPGIHFTKLPFLAKMLSVKHGSYNCRHIIVQTLQTKTNLKLIS
jgi:hypothetical protein